MSIISIANRRLQLAAALEAAGADLLLTTDPADILYYTGCPDVSGFLLIARDESAWLLTSAHDGPQARAETGGTEIMVWPPGAQPLAQLANEILRRRASGLLTTSLPLAVAHELAARGVTAAIAPRMGFTARLRRVKDPAEMATIRQAARIAGVGMAAARAALRPGVREIDVAAAAERAMRLLGSDGRVFETKVESGHRSARPSTYASDKPIAAGDLVLIDLGPTLHGYFGDLTRTFVIGPPAPRQLHLLEAVLAAQAAALARLQPGATGHAVDHAARDHLAATGDAAAFLHHTGHTLGLAGDALPILAPGEETRLLAGECVTVEPGLYVEGLGGVRIEDEVLLTPTGPELLTTFPKTFDTLIVPLDT